MLPVLGLATLLGGAELLTRAVLTSPSRQTSDAELGFRYLPGTVIFQASEGGARLRLNSLGLNHDEIAPKGARPRVLVVGDSMTEALQVPRAANFVTRLQELRPDLDFVNIARSDMGPGEYRAVVERLAPALQPDMVLFAFSYGDIADLARGGLEVERGADGAIRRLALQPSSRNVAKEALEPVIQRSAFATLMMRRIGPWLERLRAAPTPAPLDEEVSVEIASFVLRDIGGRWPVAALFLPQMDYRAGRRASISAESARDAALLAQAASGASVSLLLADAGLAAAYAASGQPGHGFANSRIGSGHLNPAGHEAVAGALAQFLPPATGN